MAISFHHSRGHSQQEHWKSSQIPLLNIRCNFLHHHKLQHLPPWSFPYTVPSKMILGVTWQRFLTVKTPPAPLRQGFLHILEMTDERTGNKNPQHLLLWGILKLEKVFSFKCKHKIPAWITAGLGVQEEKYWGLLPPSKAVVQKRSWGKIFVCVCVF